LGAREERLGAREERLEAKERVENRKENRSFFIKSCTKKGEI
jgi:sialic acid synthase SpsE